MKVKEVDVQKMDVKEMEVQGSIGNGASADVQGTVDATAGEGFVSAGKQKIAGARSGLVGTHSRPVETTSENIERLRSFANLEVLVCEREGSIGQGNTSRNSEVVHAGLYYPPGSLKARLCVQGREALYRYCEERGVAYRKCGKLVVASSSLQLPALREVHERALSSGVGDVRIIGREEARDMEPQVMCTEALLSPSTGIVDSHAFILALQGDAEAHGALVSLRTTVDGIEVDSNALKDGRILASAGGMQLRCRALVNCAGLGAAALVCRVAGSRAGTVPRLFFAKGNYFRYTGAPPFQRLVYPLPEPNQAGLGVHATVDLAGQVRFGPDVEWLTDEIHESRLVEHDHFNYDVDPGRAGRFCEAIRRYWPGVEESKLVPDYSGIRPKLSGPRPHTTAEEGKQGDSGGAAAVEGGGNLGRAADFAIQDSSAHGVKGLVNLFGIESPGLTASLAIADHVADVVEAGS